MVHLLHFSSFVKVFIAVLLEITLFVILRQQKYSCARWFMFYCALRNVALTPFIFMGLHAYVWAYWPTEMIKLCWLAWIAARIMSLHWHEGLDRLTNIATKVPFFIVAGLSVFYFPPDRSLKMPLYESHAQAIIFGAMVGGIVISFRGKHLRAALAFLALALAGLASAVAWRTWGYLPWLFQDAWLTGLGIATLLFSSRQFASRIGPVASVFRASLGGH